MKKVFLSIMLLCCCAALPAQNAGSVRGRQDRLEKHVYFLADDSMHGRAAGSSDAAKAREYIASQYAGLGIRPFFSNWEKGFKSRNGQEYCNVVGIIDGSDPILKNEYIVLGAHYDHLGVKEGQIYNGADDNASGTAAVIEVARALYSCREKLDRSVIIAAFDAEELGLYGSEALAKQLSDSVGVNKIKLMMSIDMVGWYGQSGHLDLEGTGTIKNGKALAQAEALKMGLNVNAKGFESSVFTATDTDGFARLGVPTLAISTGLKSPYHKPEDDAELIDYEGLDKVSGFITDFTLTAAGDPAFSASGRVAEKHRQTHKAVEIGVWAGLDRGSIAFPDAKFKTNPHAGFTGGMTLQANAGDFGFRLGAEYGLLPCNFPDEEGLYSGSVTLEQQALTIPLTILLQTPAQSPVTGFFGLGGYYRRLLESEFKAEGPSYTPGLDQGGWEFLIGMKIGSISLEVENRFQIGSMFCGQDDPRASLNTSAFKIGYIF